ncbi:unnamed protein product [Knipowitschia caucasica]|uniref:PAS domain-containing protein n=1 Tax=Knipowitschia caucasica TaxID=637954 RepID=A0AAV2K252_KNICA
MNIIHSRLSLCASTIKNGNNRNNGNNSLKLPGVNGQNGQNGKSSLALPGLTGQNNNCTDLSGFSEGDLLLQALNGFVIVVTSDGLVFYASPTIKDYLGFQESDVVHQSVFELIHTDDRTMFRQQLHFALNPPEVADGDTSVQSGPEGVSYHPDQLPPENSSFLERSFVCRFRCLLDNSSGFLALKFQGRLKYLHGQSVLRDNGTRTQAQLALFSIAMPVQPSTIVEIRAKMLLFQTKHKLDFTPMGVDGRGKIILGYSEVELCMKGSGYQFIHAADMMYCADNHVRMIKTGESGLTVFRLLSKSGGWVWVKSNAKLIFKGGRPEFIIAYQKALVNAEGEEYLRQRRVQLPFSFATGEAVLYNSPTVDVTQFQFNSQFSSDSSDSGLPGSLVDSFLKQDQTVYTENIEAPLPVDQVFMDSRALVSVTNNSWQEDGVCPTAGQPVVVKEEAKQSVMAIINGLEKMSQNGNFADMMQNLEVPEEELSEWENALKRINQENGDLQGDVRAELDNVLTNEIFDFIDSVLFKEKNEADPINSPPSCLAGVSPDSFTPTVLSAPALYQTPSADCAFSPVTVLYSHTQEADSLPASAPMYNGTQKLCHPPLLPDSKLPPLQQLQLQDIFYPSIELPDLSVSDASISDASLLFLQTTNTDMAGPSGISGQPQLSQPLLSQPLLSQPLLSQPLLSQPQPSQPQLSQPLLSQPQLSQPLLSQPQPSQPQLSQPQPSQPQLSQPLLSQPQLSQPLLSQPLLSQPQPSQPQLSQPLLSQPQLSQPLLSQPQLSQPQLSQPQLSQPLLYPQNNVQHASMAPNRQLLCGPLQQHSHLPPHADILPPLVPCNNFNSTTTFEPHQEVEQWPQSQQQQQQQQQQQLPLCGIAQNGHDPIPACHNLSTESQTFPHAGHLPRSVNGLNHIQQQGGLACGQAPTHSSCMFDQAFSSSPAGGDSFTFLGSASSLDQTAPQNSCYFHWRPSEPVVSTLPINPDIVNPNTMPFPARMPPADHGVASQPYLECQRGTQDKAILGEASRSFLCSSSSRFVGRPEPR